MPVLHSTTGITVNGITGYICFKGGHFQLQAAMVVTKVGLRWLQPALKSTTCSPRWPTCLLCMGGNTISGAKQPEKGLHAQKRLTPER